MAAVSPRGPPNVPIASPRRPSGPTSPRPPAAQGPPPSRAARAPGPPQAVAAISLSLEPATLLEAEDSSAVALALEASPPPPVAAVGTPATGGDRGELGRPSLQAPTSTPTGWGAQYKCAICGELVYESQLDHHVLICPEPDSQGVSGAGQGGETAGDENAISVDISLPGPERLDVLEPGPPEPPTPDPPGESPSHTVAAADAGAGESLRARGGISSSGVSSASGRRAGGTPARREEVRRDEVSAKSGARQKAKQDDYLRTKEAECTFAPKIIDRGSPKIQSRSPEVTGHMDFARRAEERRRHAKQMAIEEQFYADVTLRPQISRFAQRFALQQKQSWGPGEGQHSSVFERLYALSQQPTPEQFSASDTVGGSGASRDGTALRSPRGEPQSFRGIPTSELLYSDALDRRERMKMLHEQHLRAEDSHNTRFQVLSKSRRLYWQMLERQVKISFDVVTDGGTMLRYSSLEDFLVHFGCMRSKPGVPGGPSAQISPQHDTVDQWRATVTSLAQAGAEDESRRLRTALWQHLDPHRTGQVDLLTLTVFFHVLMGAVDEAARAGAQQGMEMQARAASSPPETPPPANRADAAAGEGPGEGDAAGLGLTAIFEDDGGAEDESRAYRDGPRTPEDLPFSADDEGRRICELLLRFDPKKLRAEFRELYLHRLHYQGASEKSERLAVEGPGAQTPEINAKSRAIAEELIERQKDMAPEGSLTQHADLLKQWHEKVEDRKEEQRARIRNEEMTACTFRPQLRPTTGSLSEASQSYGPNKHEHLYQKGRADREKKEVKAEEGRMARSQDEVVHCSFKPNLNKSERSYIRGSDGGTVVPRGYYEAHRRMRQANEVRSTLHHQKTDRLAVFRPVHKTDVGKTDIMSPRTPSRDIATPPAASRGIVTASPRGLSPRGDMDNQGRGAAGPRSGSPGAFPYARDAAREGPVAGMPLPTVAEDPSLDGRGGARRTPNQFQSPGRPPIQRDRSPGGPPAPVARSNDPGSPTRSPATTPRKVDPRGLRSPGGPAPTSNGEVASAAGGPQEAEEGSAPPPLLYVDVNISPGQPPERIVLREGQSVSEIAAEFAVKHVLTPVLAQRLHALLKEVLDRHAQ